MPIQSSSDPKAFNDFEHAGWEGSSAGYERHFARLTRKTVAATRDAARVAEGTRVSVPDAPAVAYLPDLVRQHAILA